MQSWGIISQGRSLGMKESSFFPSVSSFFPSPYCFEVCSFRTLRVCVCVCSARDKHSQVLDKHCPAELPWSFNSSLVSKIEKHFLKSASREGNFHSRESACENGCSQHLHTAPMIMFPFVRKRQIVSLLHTSLTSRRYYFHIINCTNGKPVVCNPPCISLFLIGLIHSHFQLYSKTEQLDRDCIRLYLHTCKTSPWLIFMAKLVHLVKTVKITLT